MSTEWPLLINDSAPAGTSAMRFSLVLISFGTPIFINGEIGCWGSGRKPLKKITRPERHNCLSRRCKEIARDSSDLLARDRADESEHFIASVVGLAVQLDPRAAVHPGTHALERERD